MVATIEKRSKSEIQVFISFPHTEGNLSTKIHKELTPIMGMMS